MNVAGWRWNVGDGMFGLCILIPGRTQLQEQRPPVELTAKLHVYGTYASSTALACRASSFVVSCSSLGAK